MIPKEHFFIYVRSFRNVNVTVFPMLSSASRESANTLMLRLQQYGAIKIPYKEGFQNTTPSPANTRTLLHSLLFPPQKTHPLPPPQAYSTSKKSQ